MKFKSPDGFHPSIEKHFKKTVGGILFEDDVYYLDSEIEILKATPGFDYKTIHNAKKIFKGFIDDTKTNKKSK